MFHLLQLKLKENPIHKQDVGNISSTAMQNIQKEKSLWFEKNKFDIFITYCLEQFNQLLEECQAPATLMHIIASLFKEQDCPSAHNTEHAVRLSVYECFQNLLSGNTDLKELKPRFSEEIEPYNDAVTVATCLFLLELKKFAKEKNTKKEKIIPNEADSFVQDNLSGIYPSIPSLQDIASIAVRRWVEESTGQNKVKICEKLQNKIPHLLEQNKNENVITK